MTEREEYPMDTEERLLYSSIVELFANGYQMFMKRSPNDDYEDHEFEVMETLELNEFYVYALGSPTFIRRSNPYRSLIILWLNGDNVEQYDPETEQWSIVPGVPSFDPSIAFRLANG